MNIEQAIHKIKYFQELIGDYETREDIDGLIDAIDLAIEALEKQTTKNPICKHSYENADADGNRGIWMDFIECPNCGCDLTSRKETNCPDCNQLINWIIEDDVWNGFWD